ncbi:hypothetical protein T310_6099 [Rasamsonia emersonii CBS 393.64]|uniref:Uncharacterized protein n=1 Tax=Rasamsonia emersonii (strain ATCC 16479 / CBS 393.64 / IMI 116815) TaxID=1408163 RepID=A0A0F4YP76_RASE3|nr:hypothetical protein T310_6099 [Rasamsonia emersonii CBS 393.64]KKA19900.1 hypothetical protein T310_6099 [Rasamsonia emersonii CBS 393.64]
MGVDTRRPVLPAPTDSVVDTAGSATATDLATDVSRRTDKSSYSIPDDGSPITISTRRRSHKHEGDDSKLSRSSHRSQTSLLIEYFEGGKGSGGLTSRPSVRVKVTPSAARKLRDQSDHIQISETSGKKALYTRRISLGPPSKQKHATDGGDDQSVSSEEHGTQQRRPPLEIEFVDRDQNSELSNDRYFQPASEISSMPPDSMLEGSLASPAPRRKRSQSLDQGEPPAEASDLLKAPSRRRSRSLSRERIAYKVAQKLNSTAGDVSSSTRKRSEKSRSRGESKELLETDSKSLRKRSHRHHDEEPPSVESSLLSGSAVSSRHKSGDQYSFRSSRSSLNNPKLLETVEDAIRRLILPELKELKKDQKVSSNKAKFERDISASQASGTSKDELGRQLSKHSSAPDIGKSSSMLHKTSKDEGLVQSEERQKDRKERRRSKEKGTTSPSEEKIYVRKGSLPGNRPELTEEEKLRRQRSKGLRDAEAAGIVGTALTAAALKHHDSKSTLDDTRERRKRRAKSHTKSDSINDSDTDLIFQKHNVPPMPLRSDIDTELTRESLLSQRTEETETPTPRPVREVARGSLGEVGSPASRSPSRTPPGRDREKSSSPHADEEYGGATGDIAAAAAANLLGGHPHHDGPRALSPIQSVASDHDQHEAELDKQTDQSNRYSIDSLSSAPSTDLARSIRQNQESRKLGYEEESRRTTESEVEDESEHSGEDEASHDSEPRIDEKHMTNYTDDSLDAPPFLDKGNNTGRQVSEGVGANPEFVHPPVAVESAVASLLDPSVLDANPTQSQADSLNRSAPGSPHLGEAPSRSLPESGRGSPLKQQHDANSPDEKSFTKRIGATSPPQSVTQSDEENDEQGEQYLPDTPGAEAEDRHAPEVEDVPDSESEINTNPSIIQGPIGGIPHENRDHWPFNPTPPQLQDMNLPPQHDSSGVAYNQPYSQPPYGNAFAADAYARDNYMDGRIFSTPPGAKDEGYISAANPMSPSNATPEPRNKGFSTLDTNPLVLFDNPPHDDDPFATPGQQRHFSGYSHGIPSPLYDGATGRGIESIQSKDIIALMEHLTVRDAQRNARDTEILVTLVRSAAEMRNSFEDMKRFIAQQDEMLMQANDKQHERTQRVIGGPRPQPPSKSSRHASTDDYGEDVQSKRRNVFRRALKSLSLKSSNDLSKIEYMLEQLLDEVEALRAAQEGRSVGAGTKPGSINSNAQTGNSYQDGYEPEGQAGTSSTGQSGYTSNSSRPIPENRGLSAQRGPENRVSTVPEGDEEGETYEHEQPLLERDVPYDDRLPHQEERGVSEPAATPPRVTGAVSNETTPRKSEGKSRKHKSSSSSFFPKISRWSKTTASSVGENIRNTIQPGRKERPLSEGSRSGVDLLQQGPYNTADYYDPNGDDRLRSRYTLDEQQQEQQENRPPSPLVPSQVSDDPKYRAHRDSLNLQHPQPRQGPTDRFQSRLESQAQNFVNPVSPNSDAWGSNSSLPQMSATGNRYGSGGRLTPISDAGYSETGSLVDRQNAPPRPPKIKDDGPLVPQRPPKIKEGEQPSYTERFASHQPPQRRPTGPRPITSSGRYSPANMRRQRYRGSPTQIDYGDEEY